MKAKTTKRVSATVVVVKRSAPSWEEMCKDESRTTYRDWYEDGVRCLIVRGPGGLCAYLGVPIDHHLSGRGYDNIPLDCHGGLTYSGEGDGKYRPKNWYWYGWDYSHSGDYAFYYDQDPLVGKFNHGEEKKWLVDEVESEVRMVVRDFKKLMTLVETKSAHCA